MKFGVVVFPGTWSDTDCYRVVDEVLQQEVEYVWHKDTQVADFDCLILPGGFSYGDYLRCGAIARFSPVMNSVEKFANNGGLVIGICNGFQILCESGLLPGALLRNTNGLFICDNTFLKVNNNTTLLTRNINKNNILKIPIAHAEGRYFASDETLKNIIDKDQILFQYSNLEMELKEECNPNGSLLNIAGICNSEKNVFGMMPHPERAADLELKNDHGKILFESILSI